MAIKQIQGYSIYMTKVLGKGSFGSVYIGEQEKTKERVAVKILPKVHIDRDDYLKAALRNEIDILQKLRSDNIVGFYDVMESSKNYYIIQELCDGDLSADIKPGLKRPEAEAVDMLRQICNGFLALVKEGIIHRDLKPANIMKKGSLLKLGDFGFAKKVDKKSMATTSVGTPLYMSLEILRGQEYTSKCDIWALGFIFYEILHGMTPWIANTEHQLVKNIESQPLQIKRKDLSGLTEDFLRKCLALRQRDRFSWDDIFVHPIFEGFFLTKANEFKQFENKQKTIMNKVRFYISQKNLNMQSLMSSLGFGEGKEEISYNDFYQFLKAAYPDITHEQADLVFKRTDTDNSGAISVEELKAMLTANGIRLESQFQNVPAFEKRNDNQETFNKISNDTNQKIKGCFEKLHRIIKRNNLTLWKVFNDFDKKKGSLTLQQFGALMKKICSSHVEITEDEIKLAFELIDEDGSNSIEYDELDKYYSKINGIPQTPAPKPSYEPMQIQYDQPNPPYPQQPPQQYNQYPNQQQQYGYGQQPPPQYNQQQYGQPQQQYGQQQQWGNNSGNVPNGGWGYNPNMNNNPNQPYGGYNQPPLQQGGYPNQQYNHQQQGGFGQPQQPPQQGNFNPFDLLGKRM